MLNLSRRVQIIEAVIDIFKENGVSTEFTMSELASKLEIGKSTIYEYFKTKDEILSSAILYMIENSIERLLLRSENAQGDFEESLKSELRYMFLLAKESHVLVSALAPRMKGSLSAECREEISNNINKIRDFYQEKFTSIFVKGYEEGVFSRVGNEYDVAVISGMISGSVVMMSNKYMNTFDHLDLNTYIDKVYDTVLMILNN